MDALTAMKQALEALEIACNYALECEPEYPFHTGEIARTNLVAAIEETEEAEDDLAASYRVINHSREQYDLLHKENRRLMQAMLDASSILENAGDEYGVGYTLRCEVLSKNT